MVIIVGSGLSLKDKQLGEQIDLFPLVIRLLNLWETDKDHRGIYQPDDGKRTDYLVATSQYGWQINKSVYKPRYNTWVWNRPGEVEEEVILRSFEGFKPVVCEEVYPWLNRYLKMEPKVFAKGFRPIPQAGIMAIIIAMARLNTDAICLAGFDSFWDKDRERRGLHDLVSERKLISEASEFYKTRLVKF